MSADDLPFDEIKNPHERACVEALAHAGFRRPDLSLDEIRRFIIMYNAIKKFEFDEFIDELNSRRGS